MTGESDRESPDALGESDLEMFARLGIGADLLADAGVRRVTDAEAFHRYGIRSEGDKTGILFPYFNPMNADRWTARLRRDNPQVDPEGKPIDKYLCPWGDTRHFYFPPGAGMLLSDVLVPVVFVEAEKSVLAITAVGTRCGRRVLAVGTGGCWGWRGKTGITSGPNGEREETRGPLPDFGLLTLKGRKVLIVLDSNAASNPEVWQARQALAETLPSREAKVGLVDLPVAEGVNGPRRFDRGLWRWRDALTARLSSPAGANRCSTRTLAGYSAPEAFKRRRALPHLRRQALWHDRRRCTS